MQVIGRFKFLPSLICARNAPEYRLKQVNTATAVKNKNMSAYLDGMAQVKVKIDD